MATFLFFNVLKFLPIFQRPEIPQTPQVGPAGGRTVYRAWQEEGEGQYKIHKTKDWVEEVR